VLIEDGGIIVLGGLMSDTATQSEDRVPGLGAIPVLGGLFRSRSGSHQKKNLLVFIRPNIMRDADATQATSESKYNELRQRQRDFNNGKISLLPDKQPAVPALPPASGQPAPPPPGTNPQGAVPDVQPQSTPLPPQNVAPAQSVPPPQNPSNP
jgi:general secretion pathway protein D